MQALSPTVCPCYAASDGETAAAIAAFLERCGDVRVFLEEGELRAGQDLTDKAREARTADSVLVMFSRNSLPHPWPRSQWEDALVHEPAEEGVRIAFLRCDDCLPPKVLAPQFDLSSLPLKGLRQLKRWVRHRAAAFSPPEGARCVGHEADLEVLGTAVADRPGCETVASRAVAFEFARAYREDFDEVSRLECGGRSLAALAGDWAAQLGLRLEGEVDQNVERLRDFCSARRFLLLLDGEPTPSARQLIFRGRCSTLIAQDGAADPASDDPLRQVQRALRDPDPAADWPELCAQARLGRRLCCEQGRIAECYELMDQWHAEAQIRDDRGALEESAREMVWILQEWGRHADAQLLEHKRVTEFAQQMTLPFPSRWPVAHRT